MTHSSQLLLVFCSAAFSLQFARSAEVTAAPLAPIHVPPGFVVEVAAAPPLVGYPMMACFDERGRLFIAESAGFNMDEKQLMEKRPNFIRMLEDTDGDGVFDKSTIFADKLALPNGVLWHEGALYVAEMPGIWRFTDCDGDGVAEKREHVAGNVRSNGMSSTLHGPVWHPSGRLFWCSGQQGYSLDKTAEPPPGRIAPGVFFLKPDGAEHEVFAVGGRANPVEVTFNDEGEVFGTIAIHDTIDGRRDALMHWVYGGVYSHNPNDPVPLKRTGPNLPPLSRVGQVAPAGLTSYRSGSFGPEYRGDIFWSQFNTRRVVRTRIERADATFRSKDEDFLVSDSVDFHPTDVLEDADGSLLVIDTGGWFRHGCPTSHLARPEIKGGIYRVKRKDAPPLADPRGMKVDWAHATAEQLLALEDDARPAVADRAVAALAKLGDKAIAALKQALHSSPSIQARRNGVWTLARIDTPLARALVREALADKNASVQQCAANVIGFARDAKALDPLTRLLTENSQPSVRREAATALGRIRDARAVPKLLEALRAPADEFLTHSLIYALIQIDRPEPTLAGLGDTNGRVRRAALLALSQMSGAALTREQIAPLLRAEDVDLQKAAFLVAASDEKLQEELLQALREEFARRGALREDRADAIRETLVSLSQNPRTQDFIAEALAKPEASAAVRLMLLDALKRSSVKQFSAAWSAAVEQQLEHGDLDVRLAVVSLVQERSLRQLDATLKRIAAAADAPATLRMACLNAVAPRLSPVTPEQFDFALAQLSGAGTPSARIAAARTLGALSPSQQQLIRLTEVVAQADALVLPALLRAFNHNISDATGLPLVAALEKAPAARQLSADELARLLGKYPATTQAAARPLLGALGVDLEKQKARLEELSALLSGGDIARGKLLFFSKAVCATCHTVSGQGGVIGPNLTTIAEVRTGRDLLESVVFPSASIVQGYEPYTIETKDGQFHNGILARQTPEAVWIRGADLAETKIEMSRIGSMAVSPISIMPQGLDAALTREEFRDLLAYLQSLKRLTSFAPDQPGAKRN